MRIARTRDANALTPQILVGRGIQVTQRGARAYVAADPVTHELEFLNLPSLPDDAGAALVDAVQGFIDHEAGHVLFTDWSVRAQAIREGLDSAHNLVEDCYVERSMADAFPGSADSLEKLHHFFTSDVTPGLLREAGEDRVRAFEVLAVPAVRALAGQQPFADFMDEGRHWERPALKAFLKSFGPTGRDRLPRLRSTAECLEVARLLGVALGAGRAVAASSPVERGIGTSEDAPLEATSGDRAAEPEASSDHSGGAEAARADAGDEGGREQERAASGPERADGRAGAGGDLSAGRDDIADVEGREVATPRRPEARGGNAARGGEGTSPSDARAFDPFSSAVADAISKGAEAATARAPYRVWTTDLDVIEPLAVCDGCDDRWLADLDDAVSRTCGVLQRTLERALATRSAGRTTAGHRSGRLHAGSLHPRARSVAPSALANW